MRTGRKSISGARAELKRNGRFCRVSAIRRAPMRGRAEQSALLGLLEVMVEQLRQVGVRPVVALPAGDVFPQSAAKKVLVAAKDFSGPSSAERMTIGDTIGTPLLVACRRLKVDR